MLASIFGVLGVIANILIYQQKSGKKLLLYKLVSDIIWALHYFMLSAYSGAAVSVIGVCRETVFYNQDKKWAKSKLWLVFFMLCSAVSAVLTWKNPFSILPAFASIVSIISFWRADPKLSRILAYPIAFAMITYAITCRSYFAIFSDCMVLVSTTIGIIRFRRKQLKYVKN